MGGELIDGDVMIADGLVAQVGARPAGSGGIAVPGYVDLQVNGVAGVDFLAAVAGYRTAGAAMAPRASWPTCPPSSPPLEAYPRAGRGRRGRRRDRRPALVGVHLEGPFLSPRWPGAHDPRQPAGTRRDAGRATDRWRARCARHAGARAPGRARADRGAGRARGRRLLRPFRRRRRIAHAAFDAGAPGRSRTCTTRIAASRTATPASAAWRSSGRR